VPEGPAKENPQQPFRKHTAAGGTTEKKIVFVFSVPKKKGQSVHHHRLAFSTTCIPLKGVCTWKL
jgi:hypothetical protein